MIGVDRLRVDLGHQAAPQPGGGGDRVERAEQERDGVCVAGGEALARRTRGQVPVEVGTIDALQRSDTGQGQVPLGLDAAHDLSHGASLGSTRATRSFSMAMRTRPFTVPSGTSMVAAIS